MKNQTGTQDKIFVDGQTNNNLLDAIYCLQTDLYMPLELISFYSSQKWRAAKSVLDIGTGNGYFLSHLYDLFPTKQYVGIDFSKEMISFAANRYADKKIAFQTNDLFDYKPDQKFDFIILRYVAQHISNLDAALNHCATLASENGAILILEGDNEKTLYLPEIEILTQFYDALKNQRRRVGVNHDIMDIIDNLVEANSYWRKGIMHQILVPSTIAGNLNTVKNLELNIFKMVESVKIFEFDTHRLINEWQAWCESENPYAHIGLKTLQLDKL